MSYILNLKAKLSKAVILIQVTQDSSGHFIICTCVKTSPEDSHTCISCKLRLKGNREEEKTPSGLTKQINTLVVCPG